ncbi:unnamed protein product [Rotaria sp. Silwood1]|nr:unnamed protein product [Rotaria sp. Silwood1]CAF1599048.1 unnamed protein product [Rotaria sp. Silwood1]
MFQLPLQPINLANHQNIAAQNNSSSNNNNIPPAPPFQDNSGRDRVRRGGFGGHLRRVGRGCARGGSGEVGGISNGNNIQTRRATC